MADDFPKFHGMPAEEAHAFIEKLEVNCLLRGIQDPVILLRLLQFSLHDEAKVWLQSFEATAMAQNPAVVLDYNRVKHAFLAQYRSIEISDEIWHEILGYTQKANQSIDDYTMHFTRLWDRWSRALGDEVPPAMLKKDRFVANLKENLKFKVELKRPGTFEEAVAFAREKEWKAQRLNEYGRAVNSQAGDKVEEREGQARTGTQPVSRGTDTE